MLRNFVLHETSRIDQSVVGRNKINLDMGKSKKFDLFITKNAPVYHILILQK